MRISPKIRYSPLMFILALVVGQGISCTGNRHDGPDVRETRDVGKFSSIAVSDGIDVFLEQGNRMKVEVEASEKSLRDLKTDVRGSTLHISFEGPWSINRSANAYIVMDDIEEIRSSGGSDVRTRDIISARKLSLQSSGGSDMHLEVEVSDLDIECSGGSDVIISGTAEKLSASTSGGSDLKGFDLIVDEADLQSSGGSDIHIHVVERLKASASGGSDIRYRGNPEIINIESSTSADVKKAKD